MVALVVGGSGFLGHHLVRQLLGKGFQVKVYGRSKSGVFAGVEYICGNISDMTRLRAAMEGVDYVFDFAWVTVPQTSNEDPQADVQANVVAGIGLLNVCRDANVRAIIFPSSGGTVYGPKQHELIDETSPTEPICSYGITKLSMEKYLALYYHLFGLDYRILRIANAYGEGQPVDRPQGLVGVALHKVSRHEPITVWGDGTTVRDYIYAGDVSDCCIAAALQPLASTDPRVFNVSSQRGYSVSDILAAVQETTQCSMKIVYEPARNCDVNVAVLSNQRARKVLGWSPQITLAEGLERTWNSILRLGQGA